MVRQISLGYTISNWFKGFIRYKKAEGMAITVTTKEIEINEF